MNLILVGILIFLLVYGFFWLLANTKSKTFSNFFRVSTIIGSILVIIVLFFAGRYLLSIPFFALIAGALQKRLFNIFNIIYLYKIFFNKSAKGGGFFNDNSKTVRGSMSKDEALKILGLKPNCSKKDIIKSTSEGKLYITDGDFWQQEEIIKMVDKLNQYKIINGKLTKPKQRCVKKKQ